MQSLHTNDDRVLIIAEAGVNHNGDLKLALRLIEAAAEAGADLIKFQTFRAEQLVSAEAPQADYQRRQTGGTTQLEMLRALELSREDHLQLKAACTQAGIGFLSTAFDPESLALLVDELGIGYIKVPSGELTNLPLLQAMAAYDLPVLLSTGMADLGEIEAALAVFDQAHAARSSQADVTILHCHTEYPTEMADANLRAIATIATAFGRPVGYSDHTMGLEAAFASVALGARVIEKHITLDRTLPGPDHQASLEPAELSELVRGIRGLEQALGHGRKLASPIEAKNKIAARKSIVAAREIQAGEVFSEANLTVKRPGQGISPMRWEQVLGRKATRNYSADEMIE